MTIGALEGIRVVELASFVAGPYAAKLLGLTQEEIATLEREGAIA
mgnify:CR=1 FL=1